MVAPKQTTRLNSGVAILGSFSFLFFSPGTRFSKICKAWEDVAYWLLQESKVQYSEDPVVKYGFCRGIEPVTYVSFDS